MQKRLKWIIPFLLLAVILLAFLVYTSNYYRADETARESLVSDDTVRITETGYGWLFDGPSKESVLIFYPGARVETQAYAPMLHLLASEGIDVCLVDMPFRLALFGINRADDIRNQYDYDRWYIGGHSLGGAMAAFYAAGHELDGVILCAAYPTKTLDETVYSIYGTRDEVLDRDKLSEGKQLADTVECIIEGGNHAQFGNYGNQEGDGAADISAEDQQRLAVQYILKMIGR